MTEHEQELNGVGHGQHEHATVEVPIANFLGARTKPTFKDQALATLRTIVSGAVIALIIVVGVTVAFHGQTAEQKQVQDDTLHANLAQACVLALPVTDTGRDPQDVEECFTQYGLEAPLLHKP